MISYVFLFIMLFSLSFLIYFTYNPKKNIRLIVKTITSILFVLICISGYVSSKGSLNYFILILFGLVCSLLGDIFLAFEDGNKDYMGKAFIYGVINFSFAHIFYSTSFISIVSLTFKDIILTLILSLGGMFILKSIKDFDFKGMFSYVLIYAIIISFMVSKSISLYPLINTNPTGIYLVIIGSLLFIISDLILSFVFFHKKCPKYMTGLNLLTYYLGQSLIALSVLYM